VGLIGLMRIFGLRRTLLGWLALFLLRRVLARRARARRAGTPARAWF